LKVITSPGKRAASTKKAETALFRFKTVNADKKSISAANPIVDIFVSTVLAGKKPIRKL